MNESLDVDRNLKYRMRTKTEQKSSGMTLDDFLHFERITIKEFAEKINYSRTHISQVLNGKQKPSWKLVKLVFNETGGQVDLNKMEN